MATPPTGNPPGAPPKYRKAYAAVARQLCKRGATDMDLADHFRVDVRTIERWRLRYPDFCRAVKVGKAASDDRAEMSFYRRVVGYEYQAERAIAVAGVGVEIVRWTEHVAPDAGAALNWLKNRRSHKWRDIKAAEVYSPPDKPLVIRHDGPDTLEEFYRREEEAARQAVSAGVEGLAGDDAQLPGPDGDAGPREE